MIIGALMGAGATLATAILLSDIQKENPKTNPQKTTVSQKLAPQNKPTVPSKQAEVASTNASSPNPTLNQTTNSGVESNKAVIKKRSD